MGLNFLRTTNSFVLRNPDSENSTAKDKSVVRKTYESGIAGFGRSFSALGIHPFEVMKARVQTKMPKEATTLPWLINDIKKGGFRSLYSGFFASAALVGLKGFYKYPLFVYGPQELAKMLHSKEHFAQHPILYQCAITPFVVSIDTMLQGPLRRIRNIGMTTDKLKGIKEINSELYKNPSEYWRGSIAAAIKQGFGVGTALASDAILRAEFKKRGYDTSHKNPTFVAACLANGMFMALLNTPFDVIANKTSSANPIPTKGFIPSLKYIYQTQGMKAFSRGGGLRTIIYCANTLYTSILISWGRKSEHSR